MRDIIWTLIVIWLVYRLVDAFKAISAKRTMPGGQQQSRSSQAQASTHVHSDSDIKSAIQKHLNKEGEYVDFEEVK